MTVLSNCSSMYSRTVALLARNSCGECSPMSGKAHILESKELVTSIRPYWASVGEELFQRGRLRRVRVLLDRCGICYWARRALLGSQQGVEQDVTVT